MTQTMNPKMAAKLDGLSGNARCAVLDLLDIAQGGVATRKLGAETIRRNGLAVQVGEAQQLTQAGLDYLRKIFA